MNDRKKPSGDENKNQGQPDSAFDIWLNRGLHQLFDDVANEPIPDSLLKLIEQDKKK